MTFWVDNRNHNHNHNYSTVRKIDLWTNGCMYGLLLAHCTHPQAELCPMDLQTVYLRAMLDGPCLGGRYASSALVCLGLPWFALVSLGLLSSALEPWAAILTACLCIQGAVGVGEGVGISVCVCAVFLCVAAVYLVLYAVAAVAACAATRLNFKSGGGWRANACLPACRTPLLTKRRFFSDANTTNITNTIDTTRLFYLGNLNACFIRFCFLAPGSPIH